MVGLRITCPCQWAFRRLEHGGRIFVVGWRGKRRRSIPSGPMPISLTPILVHWRLVSFNGVRRCSILSITAAWPPVGRALPSTATAALVTLFLPTRARINDSRAAPSSCIKMDGGQRGQCHDPADGQFDDWFEFFNPMMVRRLSGYYLSDRCPRSGRVVDPDRNMLRPRVSWLGGQRKPVRTRQSPVFRGLSVGQEERQIDLARLREKSREHRIRRKQRTSARGDQEEGENRGLVVPRGGPMLSGRSLEVIVLTQVLRGRRIVLI